MFGEYIRGLRKRQKLTQSRLAERAQVSLRSILHWESGAIVPRDYELRALLATLNVPVEEQTRLFVRLSDREQGERLLRSHPAVPPEIAALPLCGAGDLLAASRARQGMSREEMAARLGVSLATLSRWEKNRYAISEDALAQLPAIVNVSDTEMQALRNRLVAPWEHKGAEYDPSQSYDQEEVMAWATQFRRERYLQSNDSVDLTAIALRRRLWWLSTLHPQARFAFARVTLDYAEWLYHRVDGVFAGSIAKQALPIYSVSPRHCLETATTLNLLSGSAMGPQGDERGALRYMKSCLSSRIDSAPLRLLLLADASLYAAECGDHDLADRCHEETQKLFQRILLISESHLPVGSSTDVSNHLPVEVVERDLRWYLDITRARVLCFQKKPWEAFRHLPDSIPSPEDALKNASNAAFYVYAEVALLAGERSWTERWLNQLYELLEKIDFPGLRTRADDIARQLYGPDIA